MKKITKIMALFIVMICSQDAFSQGTLSFPDVDLNGANDVLFTAKVNAGSESWKNLYKTTIVQNEKSVQASDGNVSLLTTYPQKLDSLQGGKFLQIRNADGAFMYTASTKTLSQLSHNNVLSPSPSSHAKTRDNLIETEVSPDGNWMTYFKKTSAATASLVLSNTKTAQSIVLDSDSDFSFKNVPVLWSPDSSVLIYEKDNNVYFIDVENIADLTKIEDSFRLIGEGSIQNVSWMGEKDLVYVQNDIVFRISINELYTRALYSDVLGSGEIIGRLPWDFTERDTFWVDETGTQLVLLQKGITLFYFELEGPRASIQAKQNSTGFAKTLFSHAFVPVSDSSLEVSVLWIGSSSTTSQNTNTQSMATPLLWITYTGAVKESRVYKLNRIQNSQGSYFEQLHVPQNAQAPILSPDNKSIAFIAATATSEIDEYGNFDNGVYVYDLLTWTQTSTFIDENIVSIQWKSNSEVFIGGVETVRTWNPSTRASEVLFLSSVNRFAWDETGTKILASNNAGTFEYYENTNTWKATTLTINRENSRMNTLWRVVSSEGRGALYENILFVRSLQGESQTKPLLSDFLEESSQRPTISFAFDALDNRDGLAEILNTLSTYGLKATFFINGEFIKRFPDSVLSIVEQGHEVAPMFYTAADLLSSGFVIDETFIRRGLANNEDEFFALTNTDMELFWHPPYYRSSDIIEQAGNNAGYSLIKNVVFINDTLTLEQASKTGQAYISSTQLIEGLVPWLFDGAIIPVSVGVSNGSRPDYVYEKLDILINAIYEAGYEIAPISEVLY